MPRVCTICSHADREAINAALVADEANWRIEAQFSISEHAVRRHREEHLPAVMVKSEQAKAVTQADDLLARLAEITERTDRLYRIADGIIGKAVTAEDWRTALMAVREASNANREARANLELLGELLGELNRNPVINLHMSAEWIEVRAILMATLADYPEARAQVARALMEVQGGNG